MSSRRNLGKKIMSEPFMVEPFISQRDKASAIVDEVCAKRQLDRIEVLSDRRSSDVAQARHEIWHRIYSELPNYSLPMIGRLFNRDHTTILHGIRKHKKRVSGA